MTPHKDAVGRLVSQHTPDPENRALRGLLHAAGIAAADADADKLIQPRALVALPLLTPTTQTPQLVEHVSTVMNDRGRLADRSPLRVLGWAPDARITITAMADAGILLVTAGGLEAISRQGHLRLPAATRHLCRLRAGDRLLMAAHHQAALLTIYTPRAVAAMTATYHQTISSEPPAGRPTQENRHEQHLRR
ncbi:hypothetical protein [Pilimelia columellifera]|uniref:Uncharacterized protein n=1 Tax=Pilimelia columellifera subsp. columellifera TaxID=706583 RepID=A0ABN3NI70_9ACTN